MLIGGLDVGTTGCKLTIYDEKGNHIYNSYKEYEINRHNGEHEIDAEIIFASVCEVIKDTAGKCEFSAIGVTTFGETFVLLDENDNVLLPSMLYTDPRGEEECKWLCDALDIQKKCWSEEILNAAGVDKNLLSQPVASFHIAGEIINDIANRLGIKENVKIINGAHEQVAAAVGAGVFEVGQAVDGTGTVECITPVFDKIPEDERLYHEGYSVVPYVFDGTYVCYALSFTGGATLKWFRDNFSEGKSYAELDSMAKDEPTGVLVMPHFAGAANPYMDNGSKAAMIGLTLEHTKADIYKALMEGVTYEIMTNVEHLEGFGIILNKLFATGGGASSDIWLQIKADILNRPVTALAAKEAGTCGTCMMVGVAVGIYKDLYEARNVFVKEKKTFMPNPHKSEKYQKYYEAYKSVYNAVKTIVEKTE